MKHEFSRRIFEKNTQISNFIEIRPVGAELFHVDRHMKLIVAFRNFANAPKNFYRLASVEKWRCASQ